jgi:L-2-hydroxyglutarate oxidase LhgO
MDAKVVIVGAGIIGLSVARKIAGEGHSVILLEKEARYGCGVSSRNTEVIHAGIYYKTGSLKATLCVRGKELLYEYCQKHKVRHKRIGKMILAVTSQEASRLELMKKQAFANGVRDLIDLDKKDIEKLEPNIKGEAALFSPSSGIIDSHGFMRSLLKEAEDCGTIFAALSPVTAAEFVNNSWKVMVGGKEPTSVSCKLLINTAGLYSIDLSKEIFPERNTPTLHPTKGSYARYSGSSPINHIIYPALVPGVIEERVDATPDLEGSLRFGPTIENPKNLEDFSIVPELVKKITPAIKRYIPGLDVSRIHPDCAGIRPRIFGRRDSVEDFRFDWAPQPEWLDLWGIESPGFTASLAIAEHVHDLVKEKDIL